MTYKRILIIDDHSIFRAGLIALLKSPLPNVKILEASSVEEAIKTYSKISMVLLDIALEQLNGLHFIPEIRMAWPEVKVIVISAALQYEGHAEALAAGADCFLSKSLLSSQIITTIQEMLQETNKKLYDPKLGSRQLEILELMSRGLGNKMIAKSLGISEHTVRWHVQTIFRSLDATNRSEAVFTARSMGLIH